MTTDETRTDGIENPARRKPWLAFLLSLIATGVGQVYNGQWKKGVAFFVAEALLAIALAQAFGSFSAMLGCVVFLLLFNLFVSVEAYTSARKAKEYVLQPCNRPWVYALVIVLNLSVGAGMKFFIQESFYQTYKAPSGSMIPTLLVGDHFMVEIMDEAEEVRRGDIIVFKFPEDEKRDFVKRTIGLPGETVEIRDKAVFINGILLVEPYVQHTKFAQQPVRDNFGPVTLGEDDYFVMGDNREESYDSRWFGPVRRTAIKGRTKYLYFPGNVGADDWGERIGMALR